MNSLSPTPNIAVEGTAQRLRCWVPFALRAPAAPHLQRWAYGFDMTQEPYSAGCAHLAPYRHLALTAHCGPQLSSASAPLSLPVSPCLRDCEIPHPISLASADQSVLVRPPALRALRNRAASPARALATQAFSAFASSSALLRGAVVALSPRTFVFFSPVASHNPQPNPAVNRTLRDKAAQRRLPLRWASFK